nr:DNA-binding protein RFX2 [Zootoca vivipara]
MQESEGGSDSTTPVALRTSASVQAPVVQPVPASQQRVLVQATGSTPKGAQMQQLSVPRVQQVPQQVQTVQHVYPAQVQYVEGGEAVYANGTIRAAYSYNTEAQIYAPSSASSYFEAQGGSSQVSTGPSSPTTIPSHGMVGIAMDIGGSQIVSSSGAYLIHSGMESARHALSHTSRSSPATLEMAIENLQKNEGITSHKSSLLNSHLQWLLDNYETAEGVSLPRSSLYNHYLRHCQEHKLDPVNAASFGKLIRSVFMGLRTRRLGTRGNSKYHYYGIRLKPDSPLNRLQEDTQYLAMRQQPIHQKQRYRPSQKLDGLAEAGSNSSLHSTPEQSVAAQSQHHQQFIGEELSNAKVAGSIPVWGSCIFVHCGRVRLDDPQGSLPTLLGNQRHHISLTSQPSIWKNVLLQEGIEASDARSQVLYRRHARRHEDAAAMPLRAGTATSSGEGWANAVGSVRPPHFTLPQVLVRTHEHTPLSQALWKHAPLLCATVLSFTCIAPCRLVAPAATPAGFWPGISGSFCYATFPGVPLSPQANVDVVMSLQFPYIEKLWQSFWNSESHSSESASAAVPSSEEPRDALVPRHKLIAMCKYIPIMKWMRGCDHILYQTLVEILIPDVLRPVPSTLTQAIRNFAKSLEGWLINAMSDFPQQIVQTKVGVVSAFAQTLRRYTSLNHLAQAARAVLQNTSQINQMLSDLNRVDFANVQEQASWVCQCEEGLVQKLEQDFKLTLQQQSSLDQWASWLDNVVTQVLKHHEGGAGFPKAARQFLLKWSFYSSMVIRDLTLRSAASFGSFHLIRLLYDEYMFYLVEHRVAQATGETPIAVMGEFSDLASMSPALIDKDDISDLGSEAEADSRCAGEPLVKRERSDPGPSLQEI